MSILKLPRYPELLFRMPQKEKVTSSAKDLRNCMMLSGSKNENLMNLTRAWITAASALPADHDNELFWKRVASAYAAITPPIGHCHAIDTLQKQWKAMRPAMVAFVTLFSQKYRSSKVLNDKVSQAFEWAIKTFHAATKKEFEYVSEAWLLVTQATWWTVLKPQLMHQFASMHEEDDRPDQYEKQPSSAEVSVSTTQSRRVDDGGRRVKQRIEFMNADSLMPANKALPSEAQRLMVETRDDQKSKAMVRMMERRLELDIMTQSDVGLSAEAKEYLALQRQLILQRLKEKMEQ